VPARPPPTARMQKHRETLDGARTNPMGKRLYEKSNGRYKPLVEVDLLAHVHPAFRPSLCIITYNSPNCYHFEGQFSQLAEIHDKCVSFLRFSHIIGQLSCKFELFFPHMLDILDVPLPEKAY
jgi:hypothetical protein